ncbi:MAG: nitrilase-related carbon-nitrogen hydrolase, partial [Wenzhouxiangella sp.]
MSRNIRIGLVQHAMGLDADENRQASINGIERAAADGADLVLLPELHASEYFCKYQDPALFELAEPLDGPTCNALASAAREHGVVVVGSIFEHRAPGLAHNTAMVLEADGSLA